MILTHSQKALFVGAVVAIAAILGLVFTAGQVVAGNVLLDENRNPATFGADCTPTATLATIGHQQSTRILATSTKRAWAMIQSPDNATNTAALGFRQDIAATFALGYLINVPNLNGATSTPRAEFGVNTEFPYTGSVTGLTDNGSTTVAVLECVYP